MKIGENVLWMVTKTMALRLVYLITVGVVCVVVVIDEYDDGGTKEK